MIWKRDMSRCAGFDHNDIAMKAKNHPLPCYPSSIIYGHTASRGLDVKRWSVGLDTGCVSHFYLHSVFSTYSLLPEQVYGRRLTALVFGLPKLRFLSIKRQGRGHEDEDDEDDDYYIDGPTSVPFGDNGRASIVSVSCS